MPIGQAVTLATHLGVSLADGDVPFYDLPFLQMRGIPIGRFVDNAVVRGEIELRWDVTTRWTLLGFAGLGRVADSIGDLGSADNEPTVGAGFRYLIARQYGLRLGMDVAYGDDDDWTIYIGVGTGWPRP